EMHITAILIFAPDDLHRVDDLVLRGHPAFDNARRQKQTIDQPGTLHVIEHLCQFIRPEGEPLHLPASGPERAVIAVLFAGCGHHCLEDGLRTGGGLYLRDAVLKTATLARDALFVLGRITSRFVQRDIAHLHEPGGGIRLYLNVHDSHPRSLNIDTSPLPEASLHTLRINAAMPDSFRYI